MCVVNLVELTACFGFPLLRLFTEQWSSPLKNISGLTLLTAISTISFSVPSGAQSVANTITTFRQFDVPALESESSCVSGTIYSSDGSMAPKPFAEAMIVCRPSKNQLTAKWIVHITNDSLIAGRTKGARIELPTDAKAQLGRECTFDQSWSCKSFSSISKLSLIILKDPDFMDEEKDFKYLTVNASSTSNKAVAAMDTIELGALKGTIRPPDDFPSCEYRVGKKLIAQDSFQEPSTNGIILNFGGDDRFVPVKEIGNKMNPTLVGQLSGMTIEAKPGKTKSSGRGSESTASTPIKISVTTEGGGSISVDAIRQCGPN